MKKYLLFLIGLLLVTISGVTAEEDRSADWPEPSTFNRPGAYWWWMGSAVDKENITWNLETMRKAGMGGATIVPIYGVKGYEDKYIQHLSPKFIEMMSHATKEAKRLGMWVDMTPGTGWPFGGPMITDDNCDATVVYKDGKISQKFSGRNVKRAAPGGTGKAINPYSPDAMTAYLKHFDKAFTADGAVIPRAMYHDSFEFKGNWCKELPDEFKKLRGYDLTNYLPELFGEGDPETVARIKSDYRETLSDLHLEYIEVLQKWANSKGRTVRNQAHGSPSNLLDLYGAVGIPETETFGATPFKIPGIRREADNVRQDYPQPLINRMASSAAHVTGKPLVSSESCTWIRNHFRSALSQVKPEIDQLFLNGINHIFFHGTCYSPKDAPWPGWLFYASLEYNWRNAIWRDASELNAYITSCQSILQSGKPDNDVALYWPIYDIWHNPEGMQQNLTVHHSEWLTDSACGKTAEWLKKNGYGYDFISDRQLLADKGSSYKAIVVPETKHIPLATLKKLLALARRGQPVLFVNKLPTDIPGFHEFKKRQTQLEKIKIGKEKLVVRMDALKERLKAVREPMAGKGLDFIRRKHENGYHYFIANMSDKPVNSWVELGTKFKSTVIMDAYSAKTGLGTARNDNELYLQLLPGETRIIRTFTARTVQGTQWPILIKTEAKPFNITGNWNVSFIDGAPALPSTFTTSKLKSWTELGDKEAQRFAGTARYAIEFELPKTNADDWIIDLGDVRESARVIINGGNACSLYSIPYRAPVGRFLKPGRNTIEIEVTNLSANRIRDLDIQKVNWKIFNEINLVDQNYKKFDASTWPLTPSGLLGPVTLTPMRKKISTPAHTEATGFISIFDGKTLEGWHAVPEDSSTDWAVGDGVIVGTGSKKRLSYLVYKDEALKDFELKLSYRLPGKGNTGVEIRSQIDTTGKRPFEGYHADLGHAGIGPNILGAWDFHFAKRKEYPCKRGTRLVIDADGKTHYSTIPNALAQNDINKHQWNHIHVIARGNSFQFFINGKPASGFTDNFKDSLKHGAIGLQIHDKRMRVEFKDVRLKRL